MMRLVSTSPFSRRVVPVADIEIDRRIKFRIVEFLDYVGTHDAQLRCTMGNESRDVEGAHADQAHVLARSSECQRAVRLVVKGIFRHDARARHDGQRLFEDAALGNGKGKTVGHCGAADRVTDEKGQRIWPMTA
jgi:hypothetical protein